MKRNFKAMVGLVAGLTMATTSAWAANITGAGSTFVYPIIAKWATSYQGTSGNNVNYQSIGSGGGIAQVKAKTVTFGATDKPLTAADL
ncbi:MAG TPA: substrate-binding domain-containing protein, partial [Rhizomicrobium sp.]